MHKAGFVNIVGNPNVGKSTLMNALVGERISIATFKAQTTRHRIMGIYNTDDMQIVFSDTPGVLKPQYKLQESMLNFSTSALTDADVLLYVTDVVETPDKHNEFIEKVARMEIPVLLLINKIDLTSLEALPTSVFPVLPSASLANALLTVELLTAIPLAAASVLSAEVLVVALPASVLGVCDEVLSSLGFLPCRAITPPESAYYSVLPGDSSRFRAIESRSESPPEMPIYSVRYPSFPDFPHSCCSR